MWIALLSAAHAACPADAATLALSLEAAETGWVQLDRALLERASSTALADADCLQAPLPTAVIARLHRVEGLAAFVAEDLDRARGSLAAAKAIEPDYVFPPELVPLAHPIQVMYREVQSGESVGVPAPAEGTLVFDGLPGKRRPVQRATLVWLGDEMSVTKSTYLWPGEPLFAYELPRGGPRNALLTVAGTGAVVSVTTAILAAVTVAAWRDTGDVAETKQLYARNRVLVGVSVGSGVLALGSGALGVAW